MLGAVGVAERRWEAHVVPFLVDSCQWRPYGKIECSLSEEVQQGEFPYHGGVPVDPALGRWLLWVFVRHAKAINPDACAFVQANRNEGKPLGAREPV